MPLSSQQFAELSYTCTDPEIITHHMNHGVQFSSVAFRRFLTINPGLSYRILEQNLCAKTDVEILCNMYLRPAINAGCVAHVQRLLGHLGVNVTIRISDWGHKEYVYPVIAYAIRVGNQDIVDAVLEFGPNLDTPILCNGKFHASIQEYAKSHGIHLGDNASDTETLLFPNGKSSSFRGTETTLFPNGKSSSSRSCGTETTSLLLRE